MSDPWSSLQAPGVSSDEPASGVHPAYANYDDQGHPQVGFDIFMELPAICLKCAEPATAQRVAEITVKRDLLSQIVQRGGMSQRGDKLSAGKCKLDLPHCESCLAAYTRARKSYVISFFYPAVALAIIVAAALIAGSVALVLLLVALVAVPVARGFASKRYRRCGVDINALDTDGFIVLTGVDPQAGEAIVAASQGALASGKAPSPNAMKATS